MFAQVYKDTFLIKKKAPTLSDIQPKIAEPFYY